MASGQHIWNPCDLQPKSTQVLNPVSNGEGEFRSVSVLSQLDFELMEAQAVT